MPFKCGQLMKNVDMESYLWEFYSVMKLMTIHVTLGLKVKKGGDGGLINR